MNVAKLLFLPITAAAALALTGCNQEMTDGGSIEKNIKMWQNEDKLQTQSLKPELQSYWSKEKARWPKFKKKQIDASDCYDQDAANTRANGGM